MYIDISEIGWAIIMIAGLVIILAGFNAAEDYNIERKKSPSLIEGVKYVAMFSWLGYFAFFSS